MALRHKPSGVKAGPRTAKPARKRWQHVWLRINLALEVRRPVEIAAEPSPLGDRCGGAGRIARAESHADFPAILAEVLDVLSAHRADVKAAAEQLGCTVSQIVKLLKQEPRALLSVNRWREGNDLHRLQSGLCRVGGLSRSAPQSHAGSAVDLSPFSGKYLMLHWHSRFVGVKSVD